VDILHLIDRLEELVGEARKLPVGGGAVISRQRLLDLIDRMRVAVPKEVYDAREIIEKREEVLADAGAEASRLIARAQEEVETRPAWTMPRQRRGSRCGRRTSTPSRR
jgi:hypothetical protein